MSLSENVERKKDFNQVCIWPGTIVYDDKIKCFEEWFFNEFQTRIQYLETIETYPDKKNGEIIEGTGGRHDVFFAVHNDDINRFSVPKLSLGVRWIEDVLSKVNYIHEIYPKRVFQYKTWEG